MPNEIDYAAVLADLEAKRSDIDNAIAGVRQLLNLGTDPNVSPTMRERADQLRSDSFFRMSLPAAILKFLDMAKCPQSASEVMTALLSGGFKTTSKNFTPLVSSNLSRLKANGELVNVEGKLGMARTKRSR